MKILITGVKGMLGSDLMKVLSRNYQAVGIDIEDGDITKKDEIIKVISDANPSIVVHTAAYTDVDGCEGDPDLAYKVNVIGTQNICLACQKVGAALMYLSTDFVFDGNKKTPYIEFDQPNPINIYGKSKLAGEQYVQSLLHKFFIVRTAWLFGKKGKNFVKTILKLAKRKKELKIVNDQIGSPTYTLDLIQQLIPLLNTDSYGIYHIANKGRCSWYEFAQEILKCGKIKGVEIQPIFSYQLNRPAKRPAFSVLRNYCLELTVGDTMRSWEGALKRYMGSKA